MRLAIIGTGYVGLVTGVCLAESGHEISCIDIDADKIKKLSDAIIPIYEPGVEDLVKRNITLKRLSFRRSIQSNGGNYDAIFLALGTPQGIDGQADLSQIKETAKSIAPHLSAKTLVVVKSTVPVGTSDEIEALLNQELKRMNRGFSAKVASNPEFLAEGTAVRDFMRPDRIIIGVSSDEDAGLLYSIYKPFALSNPGKIIRMDRRSAELTKYASNGLLATKISFMNELSRLAESCGANINAVRVGMGSDSRIGNRFLYAGPGYGGSCFPKDVKALMCTAKTKGLNLSIIEAVEKVNDEQIRFIYNKIVNHFGSLEGRRLCLWGLSFKPRTNDVRESPSLKLIKLLIDSGCLINAHDPMADIDFQKSLEQPICINEEAYDALQDADALILMTEWQEYRSPNWKVIADKLKSKALFDFRNQWERQDLENQGFAYYAVGC